MLHRWFTVFNDTDYISKIDATTNFHGDNGHNIRNYKCSCQGFPQQFDGGSWINTLGEQEGA